MTVTDPAVPLQNGHAYLGTMDEIMEEAREMEDRAASMKEVLADRQDVDKSRYMTGELLFEDVDLEMARILFQKMTGRVLPAAKARELMRDVVLAEMRFDVAMDPADYARNVLFQQKLTGGDHSPEMLLKLTAATRGLDVECARQVRDLFDAHGPAVACLTFAVAITHVALRQTEGARRGPELEILLHLSKAMATGQISLEAGSRLLRHYDPKVDETGPGACFEEVVRDLVHLQVDVMQAARDGVKAFPQARVYRAITDVLTGVERTRGGDLEGFASDLFLTLQDPPPVR
ncbi:MAG: hypothetical protein AAGH15_05180 [Myxococcota bacterium]